MKKANKNRDIVAASNISDMIEKKAHASYGQTFMRMDILEKRGNKTIYLSSEHHERLTRIVQVIGDDKIPLFAYLNNILEHHFKVYEEDIIKEFKEKYKPLF